MDTVLNAFTSIFNWISSHVFSILPDDPFTDAISSLSNIQWLHALNWVVPVGTLLSIATAWGACILVWYIYSIFLRWAKVVGD